MPKNPPNESVNSRVDRRQSKKSSWKKGLIVLSCIIGLLIIGCGIYSYNVYNAAKDAVHKMHQPVKGQDGEADPVSQGGRPQPISILLMGIDKRPHKVGRSDTLIVMTLNPKTNKMQMVSIPRDTRVEIPGHGTHKINAAYAYGGSSLALKTVKNYLNVPIPYYIRINMQGLAQLVTAVGGITVHNDISWHDPGYYKKGYFYQKGKIHLTGPQAVGYVRMRYLPGGDFERNKHQRKVIMAVVDKAASFSSITRYKDILNAISDNVRTNLTFADMKYIALHYRDCRKHIKTYELKGHPEMIGGVSWVIVSDEERLKGHDLIMKQLQTDTKASN